MEFRYFLDDNRLLEYSTISDSDFETLATIAKLNTSYQTELLYQIDVLVQELLLDVSDHNKGIINYLKRSIEIENLQYDLLTLLIEKISPDVKFWEYLLFSILDIEITKKCLFTKNVSKNISLYMIIISDIKLQKQISLTDNILKNKILKKLWIDDCINTLNFYKLTMNNFDSLLLITQKESNLMENILTLLFHYWNNGINKLNPKDLNITYLTHNHISIYQYQIPSTDSSTNNTEQTQPTYPLMVHLFYIGYAYIEVIYIGLISKISILDDIIKEVENVDNINVDNRVMMETRSNMFRTMRSRFLNILRNNSANVDQFFITLFDWVININEESPTLFGQIIQTYLTFYSKSETMKLGAHIPQSSLSSLIGLFNEETLTKPSQMEIYELMERNLFARNIDFLDDYYFRNGSLIAIINLYLHLENDNYNKHNYRFRIHKFLSACFILSKSIYQNWLIILHSGTNTNILKFLNIIFSDLSTFLEKSLEEIELIHLHQIDPENEVLKEKKFNLETSKNLAKTFLHFVNTSFDFLDKMNNAPLKYYLSSELNSQIAKTFDFYLTKLLGHKNKHLKINCSDEIGFNPLQLLISIGNIMYYILGHEVPDIFIENLCDDPCNFDINIYKNFQNICKKKGVLNINLETSINILIDKLNKYIESYGDIEVPDEFCDPFFCNTINNPVCVPSSGIIMDSNNLRRMILENNRDPYQQELTMEQLEEFNKKDTIKEKLDEFIRKKNEWFKSRRNITK
jgi:hypothetical protein